MKTCRRIILSAPVITALVGVSISQAQSPENSTARWWRGNLHTHSLWSDGDDYPEMITAWYQDHGYNFLGLSDHNTLQAGDKWKELGAKKVGDAAFEKYLKRFGDKWVETKEVNGKHQVRLKRLDEFRGKFEKPGHFLLIQSEEITDSFNKAPIHMNASNLRELIKPQGGKSATETMQNNINAVMAQREKTGQPMIPHLNHPNFRWALTAEDIAPLRGERFVEVYNGHPGTMTLGDSTRAGTERIWDIILTKRLGELGLEPMWGTAVDDSHNYHAFKSDVSNPGRGWIMVRASKLAPEALITAMEAGDFYASSGVRLKDIQSGGGKLAIEIDAEQGVSYTTQFIGTRKGYDASSKPVLDVNRKEVHTTRQYSKEVGAVLAQVQGTSPSYTLKGDEIYVRATVTSSKPKANPSYKGDMEKAWVQPVVGKKN